LFKIPEEYRCRSPPLQDLGHIPWVEASQTIHAGSNIIVSAYLAITTSILKTAVPPTEAPSHAAPAVSDNSGDRAIAVVPSASDNLAVGNVPGKGVDNPPTIDFKTENQNLVGQNVINDLTLFDSATGKNGAPDPEKEAPISTERRKEIDDVKSRVSDSTTGAMDQRQQDRFFGSAIDSARDLTAAKPEDRQQTFDSALKSVPPDQRETFNKAIGAALHEQGSNLRTGNEPPVGLLIDRSAPGGEKIVGRSSIVEFPENFQADQKALESAPKVSDAIKKTMSDVPADKQDSVGNDMGNLLSTQEKHGLLAPIKDVGARERPDDLPSQEAQAAKLKGQWPPQIGTEPIVNAAVDAANNIAFAKPEDMNRLFNTGMDNLRAAGADPAIAAGMLGQALNNISKDLHVKTESGKIDQAFLTDRRLATSANPDGTIGAADTQTAPGDVAANHAIFTKTSEVAAAIRTDNTNTLGPNPNESEIRDHVDRVFRAFKYF